MDDPYKRVFGISGNTDADLSSVRSNDLLARSLEILKDIYDEGGCRYDLHGNCISHHWMNKENHCPHVRARALFEEIEAA